MASTPFDAGVRLAEMSESGQHCARGAPSGFSTAVEFRAASALIDPPRGRAADQRRVAVLARALESEVIPRLLLSRRGADQQQPRHAQVASVDPADLHELCGIVLRGDFPAANAFVFRLQSRGLSLERIYLDVLAPVARQLGDLWLADLCDFTSVTIGLCCLQQVVLENSAAFGPRPARGVQGRRVLLAPTPGEQHSFGLLMVGEFFRRHGWDVHSASGASVCEIGAMLRSQWFGIVGFSLASDERLEPLATLIREIRRGARNQRIGVLVGGQAFLDRPELTALVGADATATDGQQAVLKAEALMALLAEQE